MYLYFLIPAAIAKIFNLIAELVFPIGIQSKEAKAEMDIHPVFQYNLELYKPFFTFYSSIHFALYLRK